MVHIRCNRVLDFLGPIQRNGDRPSVAPAGPTPYVLDLHAISLLSQGRHRRCQDKTHGGVGKMSEHAGGSVGKLPPQLLPRFFTGWNAPNPDSRYQPSRGRFVGGVG